MSYVPGSDTPTTRRGPHPLKALAGFAALVGGGILFVTIVTGLGRLLQR